ncbi:MAG: hypothetical protein U0V02_02475 [Anaerolineales bacterium]
MAKKDDDFSPAEDYLSQLEWQRNHPRRSSLYNEPKWKYKIIYKDNPGTSSYLPLILFSIASIALSIYLLYLIIVKQSEKAFFGLVIFIILAIMLFFAIRDANRSLGDDDDN